MFVQCYQCIKQIKKRKSKYYIIMNDLHLQPWLIRSHKVNARSLKRINSCKTIWSWYAKGSFENHHKLPKSTTLKEIMFVQCYQCIKQIKKRKSKYYIIMNDLHLQPWLIRSHKVNARSLKRINSCKTIWSWYAKGSFENHHKLPKSTTLKEIMFVQCYQCIKQIKKRKSKYYIIMNDLHLQPWLIRSHKVNARSLKCINSCKTIWSWYAKGSFENHHILPKQQT